MTSISLHNGRILYAVSAFTGIWFMYSAFIFLFYNSIGLTIDQFGILAAIAAVTSIAMELPSGVMADKWGRKNTLLVSATVNLIIPIIFFFGTNFWHMALAAIGAGMLNAFRSGTKEAIIYDGFKQDKNEKGYQRYIGRFFAFEHIFSALALIVGGFVAAIDLRYIFVVSIVSAVAILILKLCLREPRVYTKRKESYYAHFWSSVKDFLKHKRLLYLLYYTLIVGVIGVFYKYHQLYFDQVGFSLEFIGGMFAIMYIIAGIFAYFSSYITKRLGYSKPLLAIPFMFGVVYVVMGAFPMYWLGFLVFIESIIGGFSDPFESAIRNDMIKSSTRATTTSIYNFAGRIQVIIVSLLIGFLAEWTTLTTVYVVLGIFVLVFGPIAARNVIRVAKLKN